MIDLAQLETHVGPVLRDAGYRTDVRATPGGPMLVGQRRDFRVRWFLTQLKTSVAVAVVPHATVGVVRQFAAESFVVAKKAKGGLPNGFQSGAGCVAVLAAERVDPDAAALAQAKPTREWFQGISTFALLDTITGAVHTYDGGVVVGRVYAPFLRAQRDLTVKAVQEAFAR